MTSFIPLDLLDQLGDLLTSDHKGITSDPIWDAAGDLAIGTGPDAASRLAIGSAGQLLIVNAGATAPEWNGLLTVDVPNSLVGLGITVPTGKLHIVGSADVIQLIVKGNATQTAHLQEWQTNIGVVKVAIDNDGKFIQGVALAGDIRANFYRQSTLLDASSSYNVYSVYSANVISPNIATLIINGVFSCALIGTGGATTIRGGQFYAQHGGSGTLVNAQGGLFQIQLTGTGGSITSAVALLVLTPNRTAGTNTIGSNIGLQINNQGAAFITNSYGLYIVGQSGSATNNYAILTNAGNIVFNESGDSTTDFRVEGDTATSLFFTDASIEAVQIGTTTAGAIADFRPAEIVFNDTGLATLDFRVESNLYDALFVDASNDSIDVMHHASGKVGFFAQTPAVQQTYTAISNPPTQVEVTAIRDCLVNLGLMKAS